jgi:pimeloyl-ACP methyl ester carboxylesterase
MQRARYGATVRIERGFVRLQHGDMHYRMAGGGPVVVALHESPRSSLSLLPLIEALADRYRVIAPDTPGYGLSDPLTGDEPSMDEFVGAVEAFLDGMGLRRVALYGAHTGAAIATAFALAHPDRVTSLVLDGLSAFNPQEIEAFRTQYLKPYAPQWDGAHVMHLWSRVKDLFTWFPWYDQSDGARLWHEPTSLAALHFSALGFLQSGRHYAKAYIRAAAFQPNAVLKSLAVPTTVMARPDDLIADHLDRLEKGPGWEIAWLNPGRAAWTEAMDDALGRGPAPDDQIAPVVSREGSRFVPIGEGWTHLILAGPEDGAVRLLLPDLPGDLKPLVAKQALLFPDARLVALSPPGCGWSDPLAEAAVSLAAAVSVLDHALRQIGVEPLTISADGAGALMAQLWVERRGWRIAIERTDPPAWLDNADLSPDFNLLQPSPPRWDGAHLTGAWFQLRDLTLYDVPPGAGAPVRRAKPTNADLEGLETRFRAYVEGPESADLLRLSVAYVRAAANTMQAQAGGR